MQYTVGARCICSITVKKNCFAPVYCHWFLISFENVIIIQSRGLGHDCMSSIMSFDLILP